MIDQEQPRIKPLDDKSVYELWRIRLEAAVNQKRLIEAFASKEVPTAVERTKFDEQCLQVCGIIVRGLRDCALRVVRFVFENSTEVL